MQAGKGQNYLLPVGVNYKRERDAETYGLEVGSVLRRMEESGAALSLVILDACRDSPLPPEGRSTASRGLGRMEAPSGALIAFATAPGSVADENSAGRNGLYTQYLLEAIKTPGTRLEDVFKKVRRGVEKSSNRRQSPEEIMKLTSDEPFYFIPLKQAQPLVSSGTQIASIKPEAVVGTSLEDLEKEEQTRRQWADWQKRMKIDFEKTAGFSGSADLRVKAWERYISTWAQDNPLSRDDDGLRAQAQSKLEESRQSVAREAQQQPVAQPPVTQNATSANAPSRAGQTIKDCVDCPELVVLPAGSFMMGSSAQEQAQAQAQGAKKEITDRENPQHNVSISRFAMGKTEVTKAQYAAFVSATGHNAGNSCWIWTGSKWEDTTGRNWQNPGYSQSDNDPVACVNWHDGQAYAKWLSNKTGKQYRLPSESEWEYAARAGSSGKWSCGDEEGQLGQYAWYEANSGEKTQPVGTKKPNAFGLYDMHGNVWEWTQDCWNESYTGAPTDNAASTTGNCGQRVGRGGSWSGNAVNSRSASRGRDDAASRDSFLGFRLARMLP